MDDFYRNLEELEKLSFVFCNKGRFHIPIIIYHELFRYAYPVEPYSKFKHIGTTRKTDGKPKGWSQFA